MEDELTERIYRGITRNEASHTHWLQAAAFCDVEAQLDFGDMSAEELLAQRLERAYTEAFPPHTVKGVKWGVIARRLLAEDAA